MVPSSKVLKSLPWLAGGAFVVAAIGQADVQIFGRETRLKKGSSASRYLVTETEFALRGRILTADGRVLAQDQDAAEFGLFFDDVPNSPAFFMELGEAAGIPAADLIQLKAEGVRSRFWPEPLTKEQAAAVNKVKSEWRADGVSVKRSGHREYPLGEAASGMVGYLREGEPAAGLELTQQERLSGRDGKTVGLVDRRGEFLPMRIDPQTIAKRDGDEVQLTIDSGLQLAAAGALRNAVEVHQADRGAVVVIEPDTGAILAMANWPSIDPERLGEPLGRGERQSDFNANTMASLEPGSTFKILTLALALEVGVVRPDEHLDCKGTLKVWSDRSIRCDAHGGRRAHGMIDPEEAIAKSCNVSAAIWAQRIGYDRFREFLETSGLMDRPGLGLPADARGQFNRNEYAKGLQLATFGFGQSLTSTPVALASAFASLANEGVRMKPRLIQRIGTQSQPAQEAGRLFSAPVADQMLRYMESVVQSDSGTGKALRIPGFRLGGKTGTAQKINPQTGTVQGGGYVSNFVGYVPAQNPRAVILVMVDNPRGSSYYGASVAGPVFVDVARAVIRRYGISPTEPASSQPAGGGGVRAGAQ